MKRDCWWSDGQKSEREGGYRGFWARSDFGAGQCPPVGVEALRAATSGGWNPSAIAQMKAGGRARIDGFTPTCCPSLRTTPTGCSQDPGKSGKNGVKWSGNPTKCLGSIEVWHVGAVYPRAPNGMNPSGIKTPIAMDTWGYLAALYAAPARSRSRPTAGRRVYYRSRLRGMVTRIWSSLRFCFCQSQEVVS